MAYTTRDRYNDEIAALTAAVNRGEVPYGSIGGALDYIYQNYGIPANVSFQEVQGAVNDSFKAQPTYLETNAPKAPETPIPPTTGTKSQAQIEAEARAALIAQRDALIPQFEQLYGKAIADLEAERTSKKGTADKGFQDAKDTYQKNVNTNDKSFGDAWQQYQNAYSARGIGDSSYYNRAELGLKNDFSNQYETLNKGMNDTTTQYNDYLASLDKWANDTRANYDLQKNNFYNLDNPMVGSFDQLSGLTNNLANSYQSNLGNKSVSYGVQNFTPVYATPKYNATGSNYQGYMNSEDEKNKYIYGVR